MEKTGTLPQRKRVTRKSVVENPAQATHQKIAVTHDERRRMIAEAAHYRSLKRGPEKQADPVADWLAAEAEIDMMLEEMLADLALSE
ncbi:MAG TPA: DUF2934 domain-containing protein [Burkholderiales bacterium]|nr:DUF2934 domain-containing protein [Burkholderiales bacterium]